MGKLFNTHDWKGTGMTRQSREGQTSRSNRLETGQPSGRIGRRRNRKGMEAEKTKEREQTAEILSRFVFCSPWLKHSQVLPNIIGVLMAAAAREDEESKTKPKS